MLPVLRSHRRLFFLCALALTLLTLIVLACTTSAADGASGKRGCGSKPTKQSQIKRDTDHDGVPNWRDRNADNDSMHNGRDRDVDGDGRPNRRDRDVDGDGIANKSDDDVDGDCKVNTREIDVDGDGRPDLYDTDPYSSGRPLGAHKNKSVSARSRHAPNPFIGLVSNEALAAQGPAQDQEMAAITAAGAGTLRAKLDWATIETSPGRYDFRLWDRFVLAAARADIEVLPILYNAPSFYSTTGGPGGPPNDLGAMARFATAAVARFGPGGSLWAANPRVGSRPVRSWQVWNEPNYKAYWPTGPDPSGYTAMLKAVAPVIRALDGGAEIVAAGLSESYSNEPAAKYLQEMYSAGAKDYFDTVAVHAYARSADQSYEILRGIRKVMNRNGDSSAHIWVTEFGFASGGPASNYTVGEATQARLVQRTLRGLAQRRSGLGLKGLIYYAWQDASPYAGGKDFWGLHTGLNRIDGSAKPVLAAFQSAAHAAGS